MKKRVPEEFQVNKEEVGRISEIKLNTTCQSFPNLEILTIFLVAHIKKSEAEMQVSGLIDKKR